MVSIDALTQTASSGFRPACAQDFSRCCGYGRYDVDPVLLGQASAKIFIKPKRWSVEQRVKKRHHFPKPFFFPIWLVGFSTHEFGTWIVTVDNSVPTGP